MCQRAAPDLRNAAQRWMIDDEVFSDRHVGARGDGPTDLSLAQASARAELGEACRRHGKSSPPKQSDGLPDPIGHRRGGGNDRGHDVKYERWLRGFPGWGMIEGGR